MKPDTQQTYRQRILKVLVHIQGHLDDALCLDDLAGVAVFSPYHFHRIFRGMVGESVQAHVRRLRLERAAMRLKTTDTSVLHVAFEAGFETHEAFSRAFRAMFDSSPTEFRKQHQPMLPTPAPSGVHFSPAGDVDSFKPFETGGRPMDVKIETTKPMRVAFMRHVGPYHEVGETWQKLCGWAGPRGLFGPNTTLLGVCHDDPEVTPPEHIRYDACITAPDGLAADGDVGIQEIAGGDYAVTTHHGPYENLAATYAQLCGEWLPNSGRELRSAPSLEFYRNSPQDTKPEDLVTDIYVPLAS